MEEERDFDDFLDNWETMFLPLLRKFLPALRIFANGFGCLALVEAVKVDAVSVEVVNDSNAGIDRSDIAE